MDAPARALAAPRTLWRGRPYPLGSTWDGSGVNFALYSEHAERVELCLFDPRGRHEIGRIALRERTDFVWHGYLPEARPGQLYAYRVHGPDVPERGHRFNAQRTLIDPYARLIVGPIASGAARCRVVDSAFSWDDDRPPRVPWQDSVIYEAHAKGLTRLHPEVPEPLRGTYAGIASAPLIEHLRSLGVTALELLPIHAFVDEKRLLQQGLRNYWGYSSIGYFAPEARYSASGTPGEFKTMVKTLHAAGIELILDVVYNHTGEGDHHGPTLSFRGIDNLVYYRLDDADRRRYVDYTGTGNTLNAAHPAVLRLMLDSLRYWVSEMHVDGFRFDLASTLARGTPDFEPSGAFLAAVRQDPLLAQVKLIAEPWDLGEGGYQLGRFPAGWSEWNDKYRDAVRAYWKGDGGVIGEFASRLAGSSDLFQAGGRAPAASINFVTAHDGFTLEDLVSYDTKHNEANQEGNRDGANDNRSWNHGAEGPSADPEIAALRDRQKRNLLATLLFSQGVPMLLAGDELGRTQRGNNNAYCQDNELSWIDWQPNARGRELLAFVRRVLALRNAHPLFRRRSFFRGRGEADPQEKDIAWLHPDGKEMSDEEWTHEFARSLGVLMAGRALPECDDKGCPVEDDDLLLLLNAHDRDIDFALPGGGWLALLDTSGSAPAPGEKVRLRARSLALFARPSR